MQVKPIFAHRNASGASGWNIGDGGKSDNDTVDG